LGHGVHMTIILTGLLERTFMINLLYYIFLQQ